MVYISRGNLKLHKSVGIFSLPPGKTCPGAGGCKQYCYANKSELMYPNVRESRQRNFEESLQPDFVLTVEKYIHTRKLKTMRLHEAGDLYNQAYIGKWAKIATLCPDTRFFVYTKSLHLDLTPLTGLPNCCVIKSYGGAKDVLIDKTIDNYARVIDTPDEVAKGEYLCPGVKHADKEDDKICGNLCLYCQGIGGHRVKVCFLKH